MTKPWQEYEKASIPSAKLSDLRKGIMLLEGRGTLLEGQTMAWKIKIDDFVIYVNKNKYNIHTFGGFPSLWGLLF